MTLETDNRAWNVNYVKEDGMWFANFIFVDLEDDEFRVTMYVIGDDDYDLTFYSDKSSYFKMGEYELVKLNLCVAEAQEQLIKLEEETGGAE